METQKLGGGISQIAARAGKRAYSGAKKAGRATIKGATTLAGAAALGLVGAMFGQGQAGMAAGAALGHRIGGGITNATDRLANSVEGYVMDEHNAFWDLTERNYKRDFKKDENNVLLARQNYRDRHGKEANKNQLEEELDNMYQMSRYGIGKDKYNDVLSQYEGYKEEGMPEDEAFNTALYSASQSYSAKDLRDPKTVKHAYDGIFSQYQGLIDSGKLTSGQVDKKVRQILNGAARMQGVREGANFSGVDQVIDIPVQRRVPDMTSALGLDSSTLNEQQIKQVSNLTIRLQDEGYNDHEIRRLAETCANSRIGPMGVISNYENVVNTSIEYVENDSKARADAAKLVRGMNSGGTATKEQIDKEMRERFVIKSTFNIKDESNVSAIRDSEVENFAATEMTQREAARKFGLENKGKFGNRSHIEKSTNDLARKIHKGGNGKITMEEAKKQANNIAKQAEIYDAL